MAILKRSRFAVGICCLCLLAARLSCTSEKKAGADEEQQAGPASAKVVYIIGSVDVLNSRAGKWRKVRVGASLYTKDVLRTGKESECEFMVGDQQRILVSENSMVSVDIKPIKKEGEKQQIVMAFGKIFCNVRKLADTERLHFRTPTAVASIRGTAFGLTVAEKTGESSVRVIQGKVGVKKRATLKQIWKAAATVTALKGEQTELQDVNLRKAENVRNFMEVVSYDMDAHEERELRKKIRDMNRDLVRDAREKGMSRSEAERLVREQTEKLEKEASKDKPKEVLVGQGEVAKVSGKQKVIYVDELGPEEMDMLVKLFGENRVSAALASAEVVEREVAAGPDTMSSLLSNMMRKHLERKAEARKKKREKRGKSNSNPAISSQPITQAYLNNQYIYQVTAEDPDFDAIAFTLVNAPSGMAVEPASGLVTWVPNELGEFKVKVKADDDLGGVAVQEFQVLVSEGMAVDLKVTPEKGTPVTKFRFDGSGTENQADTEDSLSYRWDFDGNGTWDYPKGGKFSSRNMATHSFVKTGQYTAKMEVRNTKGVAQIVTTLVTVIGRPCKISGGPDQQGNMASELVFNAKCKDPDSEMIACSWDFDGDGKAEWKSRKLEPVSHTFGKSGTFEAVFSVRTRTGGTLTDIVSVVIENAPPVAEAPKEVQTMLGGGSTTLEGNGYDPDGTIRKFEWDFDGDGKFDWRSTVTGVADYNYINPGTYKAVFRVTGGDGRRATATTTVKVLQRGSAELLKMLDSDE